MSDHIFQAGDIEEICAGAKKAIDDTKDCISSLFQFFITKCLEGNPNALDF